MPHSLGLADWTVGTKEIVDGVTEVSTTFNLRPESCLYTNLLQRIVA
jgi:hypothetical protein